MSRASALAAAAVAVATLTVHAADQPQTAPVEKSPAPAIVMHRKPPAGEDGSPIPQDREVAITVEGKSLRVRSQDAVIHLGRPLAWSVKGLRDGQSVEIDFEVYRSDYKGVSRNVKGPFERTQRPGNPVRGRFVLDERVTRVESGRSDTPGYFKYHVVLRDRNGDDLFALDPGVVVKNEV